MLTSESPEKRLEKLSADFILKRDVNAGSRCEKKRAAEKDDDDDDEDGLNRSACAGPRV